MSLGGVYARVFAARHREEVVGVVLVDAYYPDGTWTDGTGVDPGWLAETAVNVDATNRQIEQVEDLAWPASRAELDDSRLDGIPLEVLAVDQHLRYVDERIPPDMEERVIESWRQWVLSLSPGMTRITIAERSGHVIQFDRPDVVIDAVRRLVDAARSQTARAGAPSAAPGEAPLDGAGVAVVQLPA
jgi:pimeloyl-ACP methyl ester carboxylesterase